MAAASGPTDGVLQAMLIRALREDDPARAKYVTDKLGEDLFLLMGMGKWKSMKCAKLYKSVTESRGFYATIAHYGEDSFSELNDDVFLYIMDCLRLGYGLPEKVASAAWLDRTRTGTITNIMARAIWLGNQRVFDYFFNNPEPYVPLHIETLLRTAASVGNQEIIDKLWDKYIVGVSMDASYPTIIAGGVFIPSPVGSTRYEIALNVAVYVGNKYLITKTLPHCKWNMEKKYEIADPALKQIAKEMGCPGVRLGNPTVIDYFGVLLNLALLGEIDLFDDALSRWGQGRQIDIATKTTTKDSTKKDSTKKDSTKKRSLSSLESKVALNKDELRELVTLVKIHLPVSFIERIVAKVNPKMLLAEFPTPDKLLKTESNEQIQRIQNYQMMLELIENPRLSRLYRKMLCPGREFAMYVISQYIDTSDYIADDELDVCLDLVRIYHKWSKLDEDDLVLVLVHDCDILLDAFWKEFSSCTETFELMIKLSGVPKCNALLESKLVGTKSCVTK